MFNEKVALALKIVKQMLGNVSGERKKTLNMKLERAIEEISNTTFVAGQEKIDAVGKVAPEVKIVKKGKSVVAIHKKGAVEIVG